MRTMTTCTSCSSSSGSARSWRRGSRNEAVGETRIFCHSRRRRTTRMLGATARAGGKMTTRTEQMMKDGGGDRSCPTDSTGDENKDTQPTTAWRPAAAVAAAAVSFAVVSSSLGADAADVLRVADAPEQLMSDFNVEFVGRNVDHKVIVELVVLGQTIGFVGAVVGGISARARKRQVENLNERLISVNKQLRQQARLAMAGEYEREDAINLPVHATHTVTAAAVAAGTATVDGDLVKSYDWQRAEVIDFLRAGKKALKEEDAHEAVKNFKLSLEKAHENAEVMDNIKKVERKAYRGLGGAYLILHDYDNALEYMKKVLDLSEEIGDSTGVGDALGVIADIYTDKGDLEKAGEWYDKYLEAMTNEMSDTEHAPRL